jgi:hypothetical protein
VKSSKVKENGKMVGSPFDKLETALLVMVLAIGLLEASVLPPTASPIDEGSDLIGENVCTAEETLVFKILLIRKL